MLTDVLIPPARTGRNEAAGDGGDGVEPKPTPGQTHNRHLPAPHRPMRVIANRDPLWLFWSPARRQRDRRALAAHAGRARSDLPTRRSMADSDGQCTRGALPRDRVADRQVHNEVAGPSICTNRSTAHGFSRWRLGQGRRHDIAEADAVPVHDPERLLREVGDMGLVTRRHCRSSRQSQVRRYRGPPDNAST